MNIGAAESDIRSCYTSLGVGIDADEGPKLKSVIGFDRGQPRLHGAVAGLQRILVFRARKTAGRAKGGKKDSVVYMHLDLVTYFESLPASDDPNAPIFPSLYRKSPGSHGGLSNAFARLMHLAGIRAPLGPEKQGKGPVQSAWFSQPSPQFHFH